MKRGIQYSSGSETTFVYGIHFAKRFFDGGQQIGMMRRSNQVGEVAPASLVISNT